jgi:hypothetical protein
MADKLLWSFPPLLLTVVVAIHALPPPQMIRCDTTPALCDTHLTLAIPPPLSIAEISYKYGSLDNEFGEGEAYDLILRFFRDAFPKVLQKHSCFNAVVHQRATQKQSVRFESLAVGENSVQFAVPASSVPIEFPSGTPDLVLLLDSLCVVGSGITILFPSAGGGNYGGSSISYASDRRLVIGAKALLWDNRACHTAAYGCVSVMVSSPLIVRGTWNHLLDRFAQELLRATPYSRWAWEEQRDPLGDADLAPAYSDQQQPCPVVNCLNIPLRQYVDFNLTDEELYECNQAWRSQLKGCFGKRPYQTVRPADLQTASACHTRFIVPQLLYYHWEGSTRRRAIVRLRISVYDDILCRRPSAVYEATGEGRDDWGNTGPLVKALRAAGKMLSRQCID